MEQEHSTAIAPNSSGMSRRVVVKSAAWSVPVLATVGVTPAFAASKPVVGAATIKAVRGPNSKDVTFTWTFKMSAGYTFSSVSIGSGGSANTAFTNPTSVTPTGTNPYTLVFTGANQSSTEVVPSFTITVSFNGGTSPFTVVGGPVLGTANLSVSGT